MNLLRGAHAPNTFTVRRLLERGGIFFTLAAVTSLCVYRGVVNGFLLQPFEPIIGIAALCVLGLVLVCERRERVNHELVFWVMFFAALMLLLAAGFMRSWQAYGMSGATLVATIKDFYLFGAAALGFLLMIYYGGDPRFRRNILVSFLTVLGFIPLAVIPEVSKRMAGDFGFFSGFHKNPTVFASFAFIGFVYLIVALIKENAVIKKFFYWIGAAGTLTLILWTGSRGVLLAVIAAVAFMVLTEARHYGGARAMKYVVFAGAVAVMTALASFSLLSQPVKINLLARFFPQVIAGSADIAFFDALKITLQNPIPSLPSQNRQQIWPLAAGLFAQQPLGLGPEYWRDSGVITQDGKYTTKAHNSFLEAALAGGVGGLILFSFFIFALAKKIIFSPRKDTEWLILSAALMGPFMATLLNGSMQGYPWFWILAGLVFAREQNT